MTAFNTVAHRPARIALATVAVMAVLLLSGCSEPLSSEQVIAQVKVCDDAGLIGVQFYNGSGRIVDIQCQQHIRN